MKLCYIEDCSGGLICYEKDKNDFLSEDMGSVICFEGTKEELEEYLQINISEKNICIK